MNTSAFVTIAALRPGVPMGGRLRPLNAGWLRMPSPLATCQRISPLFRSIGGSRAYGGLNGSGSPCGPSIFGHARFTHGMFDSGFSECTRPMMSGMCVDGT